MINPSSESRGISMTEGNEQMEAIKQAIQMEKDGRAFYLKAAAQTSSDMGREIFDSLANDELLHLDTFQKIFEENVSKDEWNQLVNTSRKYADLKVFPKDLKSIEGADPDTDELDALNLAMDAEKQAIEFYGTILAGTTDPVVQDIIREIIQQEKTHYMIMNEEFTYLGSSGHWYDVGPLGE
jgi:rubrerythrin